MREESSCRRGEIRRGSAGEGGVLGFVLEGNEFVVMVMDGVSIGVCMFH